MCSFKNLSGFVVGRFGTLFAVLAVSLTLRLSLQTLLLLCSLVCSSNCSVGRSIYWWKNLEHKYNLLVGQCVVHV